MRQSRKTNQSGPISGDLKQLLDKTRETRSVATAFKSYQGLRTQLEDTAKTSGEREYDKVMEDYEDYADLVLEAEQLVLGLSSRMEMIKDRMELKLGRGIVKVNIDLEEKMLEIEQQKAQREHGKLQIDVKRLKKDKLKNRHDAERSKTSYAS